MQNIYSTNCSTFVFTDGYCLLIWIVFFQKNFFPLCRSRYSASNIFSISTIPCPWLKKNTHTHAHKHISKQTTKQDNRVKKKNAKYEMQKEEGKIRYTNSVIIFASKKPQKKKRKTSLHHQEYYYKKKKERWRKKSIN